MAVLISSTQTRAASYQRRIYRLSKPMEFKSAWMASGCWRDNVFVERLWRTIKYEHVYLYAYGSMNEAKERLNVYLTFYNSKRPHQSLDDRTPDAVYFEIVDAEKQAA